MLCITKITQVYFFFSKSAQKGTIRGILYSSAMFSLKYKRILQIKITIKENKKKKIRLNL